MPPSITPNATVFMACVDFLLMDELKLLQGRFKQSFEVSSSFGPSVLEGAWHGPSLMDSLDEVDLGQAVARPIEGRHTIREITIHCAFWMEEVDGALHGREMVSVESIEDWPNVETAEDWVGDLERLRSVYEGLARSIVSLDPADLENTIGSHFGENYHLFTYRKTLHGISDHNLYHAGQISILKRK